MPQQGHAYITFLHAKNNLNTQYKIRSFNLSKKKIRSFSTERTPLEPSLRATQAAARTSCLLSLQTCMRRELKNMSRENDVVRRKTKANQGEPSCCAMDPRTISRLRLRRCLRSPRQRRSRTLRAASLSRLSRTPICLALAPPLLAKNAAAAGLLLPLAADARVLQHLVDQVLRLQVPRLLGVHLLHLRVRERRRRPQQQHHRSLARRRRRRRARRGGEEEKEASCGWASCL
uniref:Uncharacterized protein n=1 Tax=Oryza brachyantha TaxID=4533 RepID=J3MLC0_ORYBR